MKKLILLAATIIATASFSSTQAQAPTSPRFTDCGFDNSHSTYLVFNADFTSSQSLPDSITYAIDQMFTADSGAFLETIKLGEYDAHVSDTIFNLTPGRLYNIYMRVTNGYGDTMLTFNVRTSFPSGIAEQSSNATRLWNPQGTKVIKYDGVLLTGSTVMIVDIFGQALMSSEVSDPAGQVDAGRLGAGIYFAVISKDGEVFSKREVVLR